MKKRKAVRAEPSQRGKRGPGEAAGMRKEFRVLVEGDRLSELKVNTPGLIFYFIRRMTEKTGARYPVSTIVWTKDGSQLKRTVVDDMVMHGITVDEMKEFVDWIFVNKPPTRWNLEMMRFFYKDWINIKAKGDKHRFADAREQQASSEITMAARRLEEKQFLDFVTEGYFDDCLTKGCYALALDWRARYADVTILSEIEERYKSFAPHDLKRLGEWRAEIKSADKRGAVNYKRLFVVEMARQKELTVGETLAYFYRDELKPLFNEEELVCKGLDGMVKIV